jgi:HK97 gp10 family phage protein
MTGFSVQVKAIKGIDGLKSKLGKAGQVLIDKQIEAVQNAVFLVHETAVKSIQDHQSEGRVYKRGSVTHVASEAGYPPNTDTGHLVQSIQMDFEDGGLKGFVGTNLKYGAYLEFGTTKMAARPWLGPALLGNESNIKQMFSDALKDAVNETSK